jgi:hypothetical protein
MSIKSYVEDTLMKEVKLGVIEEKGDDYYFGIFMKFGLKVHKATAAESCKTYAKNWTHKRHILKDMISNCELPKDI